MGTRELQPELKKLFEAKKNVYSHSKFCSIDNCLYGAYLTYLRHIKSKDNIYGICGGRMHDTLEEIVNDTENTDREKDRKKLLSALNAELSDMEMLNINFPKSRDGSDGIKDGWVANMTHFCNSFIKPSGKFATEMFLLYKIDDDHYIQGYADLIRIVDEEKMIVDVYDWKTSSQFTKDDLVHHGRQLVIYKMALEQLGYTVRNTAWIMLKYCTIKYYGKKTSRSKNETLLEKVCERRKIVDTLKTNIEDNLFKLGYDELDVEIMLSEALHSNSLEGLPEEIQTRYNIKPYVRNYEITPELEEECLNFVKTTYEKWESLDPSTESEYPPRNFTKLTKTGKVSEDIFFCCNLCGHDCKYLKTYLDTKNKVQDEDDDLF